MHTLERFIVSESLGNFAEDSVCETALVSAQNESVVHPRKPAHALQQNNNQEKRDQRSCVLFCAKVNIRTVSQ
jgi:hypothetical protein